MKTVKMEPSKIKAFIEYITDEYVSDPSFSVADVLEEVQKINIDHSSILVNDPASDYGNASMRTKEEYVTWMKQKTKLAAISIVNLMEKTPSSPGLNVVRYQLIKSATSTAANYRAACRARSAKEFYSKMCIVVEEADESQFWLEILDESAIKVDRNAIQNFHKEWTEIVKIVTSAKAKARARI